MNWTITQIAFVVLCAMGSGLAFSSFGYTPILGYIITGIILGPSCFEFITDREVVFVFSEMGILFLLFAIGLSLSFEKVQNIWKKSLITTLISTILIYLIMLIIGYFLKLSHSHILLMAFCVTLSSTALTAKSLEGLKEHDKSIDENTYGILIAQDLIALVMVLIINFLGAKRITDYKTIRIFAVLLSSSGLIFYFYRYHQYIYKFTNFIKKHDDMLTLTVFGICLGSAVFSEIAGLSAPFGAFIAGLILGNSNIKQEIKIIASPIKEILLMTFFLSVGLLVDLTFVKNNFFLIFSSLIFVTFGKTIINIFVLRLCKFPLKESFVISVLLGHTGEFSFMLVYAASKVELINAFGVKFLISLTALSLFLSPFWLIFAERCRSLTNHVVVASSWEFFQLVSGKETRTLKHSSIFLSNFFKNIFSAIFKKLYELIDNVKEKIKK